MNKLLARPFMALISSLLISYSDVSGSTGLASSAPLNGNNLNLIFVVSSDLANHAPGDIQLDTANLTSQGLQRSLLLATYLQQQVLGMKNVTRIYALTPMTHLQTKDQYPDMSSLVNIQQFALLNQKTLPVSATQNFTANSFPINVAYAPGAVPTGIIPAVPYPTSYCPNCAGLDFNNTGGNNDALLSGIINQNTSGFYVFSAPWQTIKGLLTYINSHYGYRLNLPSDYLGPNSIFAISRSPSGSTSFVTYNNNLNPLATYPVLPSPVPSRSCPNTQQVFVNATTTGLSGVIKPTNININQTVYIVRHAEAHPDPNSAFEDGNYVGAGQWRALFLPNALRNKIAPNRVFSSDPALWFSTGAIDVAYVRPSLTLLPYAIANNLPYSLVSSVDIGINPTDTTIAKATSDFFFTGGKLSNQTILVAWESGHIRPIINALLASYAGNPIPQLPTDKTSTLPAGGWPSTDYDTIWTIKLDAQGNLTVHNALCEGIDSSRLPKRAPQF